MSSTWRAQRLQQCLGCWGDVEGEQLASSPSPRRLLPADAAPRAAPSPQHLHEPPSHAVPASARDLALPSPRGDWPCPELAGSPLPSLLQQHAHPLPAPPRGFSASSLQSQHEPCRPAPPPSALMAAVLFIVLVFLIYSGSPPPRCSLSGFDTAPPWIYSL